MRLPRSRSFGTLRTVVRKRTTAYTITRPDEGATGRFGETDETTSTVSNVDMWLFQPTEVNADTEYGDRLEGDLQGLALPSADVQVHDRVPHGSDEYEVQRVMHLPDNDNKQLKMFSLERRTNA